MIMRPLTARLLLVTLLVALFAPVALAVTTPLAHRCCLRKPMHGSVPTEFRATSCAQHDCCSTPVIPHAFQLARPATVGFILPSGVLPSELSTVSRSTTIHGSLSVRPPPSPPN